jgi:endonuclease-3
MPAKRKPEAGPTLRKVLTALRKLHGPQPGPPADDVMGLVLWENVAYLASDDRRAKAFADLRTRVGKTPEKILRASDATLRSVTAHGILGEKFAEKLRETARIALMKFEGDVEDVLRLPEREARMALQEFPGIGPPGAEKILLFTRTRPILALESNGLRVLVRVGFAEEGKGYAKTYAAVREGIGKQAGEDFDVLIEAHQLLRRHGQEICTRAAPSCVECPLSRQCRHALERAAPASHGA